MAVVLPFFMRAGFHGLPLFSHASCVCGFMDGCRAPAFRWVGSFEASGRILQPGTQAGTRTNPSVRRRSRIKKSSVAGMFLRCYCSICQLFKFSYRMLCAKVFSGENLIKTLFSINYRGFFIIQAAHTTINYSYFLHKTDRNTWKTNKIVQNLRKTNKKLLIIWFIRYKYLFLHH